jgi:hypothetical protein
MFRDALRNVFGTLETYTFIEKRMESHAFVIRFLKFAALSVYLMNDGTFVTVVMVQ